jgi:hypothetical protein
VEEEEISEAAAVVVEEEVVEEVKRQVDLDPIADLTELDWQTTMGKYKTKSLRNRLGHSLKFCISSESSGSESESAPEDTVMDDIESEDDDEEQTASSKPYMALLQSFNNESSAPNAKRRKLDHQESAQSRQDEDEDSSDEEGDEDEEDAEKDIDRAEDEPEDQVEEQIDEDDEDSEDEENPSDPFDVHFAHPDDDAVAKRVNSVQKGDWATKRALLQNSRATIMYPSSNVGSEVPKPVDGLDGLQLKQKLKETSSRKIGEFESSRTTTSWLKRAKIPTWNFEIKASLGPRSSSFYPRATLVFVW